MAKIDSGGTASYNGLLLSVQRRAARGVTVSGELHLVPLHQRPVEAARPISAVLPATSIRTTGALTAAIAPIARQIGGMFSICRPWPKHRSFPTRRCALWASGWRFSPIFRVLSGGYLTVTTNQDRALNGIGGQRVNQVLANPYGDKIRQQLSQSRSIRAAGARHVRKCRRGQHCGPGIWQFDAALSRTFQVRETQRLEFRAEAFNVTNSFRMNNPTTNLNSNTFGQVTSAQDPRIMQFALKYFF